MRIFFLVWTEKGRLDRFAGISGVIWITEVFWTTGLSDDWRKVLVSGVSRAVAEEK